MSIFSNNPDSVEAKQPRCPQCCSDAIVHYRHPTTNEPVCAEGLYLARCTNCEHIFGMSKEAERYIPADDRIGGTIEEELHCPTCNYNLKSLHFGATCPECGARIPPSKGAIEAQHRNWVDRIPSWASGACFALGICYTLLVRFWPQLFGCEGFLASFGLGLLICGLKGIRERKIRIYARVLTYTLKGGYALFWGIVYVVAGAVFIVLAVLAFFLF